MNEKYIIKMVGVNPTYKCNLNCFMCGQRKMDQSDITRELNIDKIKEIVLDCKKHGLMYGVYIWGGEPFLYSQIEELLLFLGKNRIFTTINTNGTLIDKFADLIVQNNIYSHLIISVDGLTDLHDKIRGKKGTYIKVKNNIEYLKSIRKRNPIISTNTVVTSENYDRLFDIICGIDSLGVDYMECQLPHYFSDECGQEYENRMLQCLDTKAVRWRGFRGSYSCIDADILITQIDKIKEIYGKRFKLAPNINNEEVKKYFINPDDILPDKVCALPFTQLHLEPNGNVVICPDFPDYVVGNIYDSTLDQIWFSQKNEAFRNMIEKEKLTICSRCIQYYQF